MQSMSIIFELLTSCGKKVIDNLYFEKLSRDLSRMTKCFENFSKAQQQVHILKMLFVEKYF